MVDYYLYAKKIVSKKMSEDSYFYPFFVCALYGLFSKYRGNGKLISDLFRKTNFIFEKGSVPEILQRHNIESDIAKPLPNDDSALKLLAVSDQGHGFASHDDGTLCYVRQNPFVVCSLTPFHLEKLLNAFCHEMGHLIKGERNNHSVYYRDNTTFFVIRTGMAHYVFSYQLPITELSCTASYISLDETINCLQTTDVMREILALGEYVEDPKIQKFIRSLDRDTILQDKGYEDLVNMVRPSFMGM